MAARRMLSRVFVKSANVLTGMGGTIYTPTQTRRVKPWFAVNGDQTLRLDYDLNASSVVFDAGGYEGQWASDIFGRFCCTVHVFEPVKSFAEGIRRRFERNPAIKVNAFGLAGADRTDRIHVSRNSSSVFDAVAGATEEIRLASAANYIAEKGVGVIDLLKINIEGGEYELLEHLLDRDLVPRIKNIQVQFHDFVPDAEKRMENIQSRLKKTHHTTYQFPFVWENWALNG